MNIAQQATAEQEPVPPVHIDWLNTVKQQQRVDNHVVEEVNRRLRLEHEQSVQDRKNMHNNWNNLTESTQTTEEVE